MPVVNVFLFEVPYIFKRVTKLLIRYLLIMRCIVYSFIPCVISAKNVYENPNNYISHNSVKIHTQLPTKVHVHYMKLQSVGEGN